ncbi:MAG: hypothetical protein Q9226_003636 [Calogaya cf. arnoldii]
MAFPNDDGDQSVERKIIMAVDFGTTYSGLAWAQTRKPEIHSPVIQWPDATSGGLEGATSDKVPTELQYNDQGYKWGFQISDFGQRHQWFKLGLDPSQSRGSSVLARKYPDPMASFPAYGHSPEKLVKDYLTALRCHAERVLRNKLPQSALISTPVEYVITIPAVWSGRAQVSTRQCAEQAGMGKGSSLHMISEPEAAAMYALDAMDPHNIKVGDTFVLCDAGGGTVDLISYKVSALKPALCIEEAAPGSGSLCGSTFLNRIFHKFLADRFSADPNWDEDVLEEAMKRFEVTRMLNNHMRSIVPGLRDNAAYGVRRGRLRLTGSDVSKIFEPVVAEVLSLVKGQIAATKANVKAVLIVGGFGQSVFLRDSIRSAVAEQGIEVMQSPNGWTAVVRGALMKGLASTNTSYTAVRISGRSARKSYGTDIERPFNALEHDISRKGWSFRRLDAAQGEIVEEDKPQRLRYFSTYRVDGLPPAEVNVRIYVCADTDNIGPSVYIDARVCKLVTVIADLSRIPRHKLPQVIGADGLLYYRISYAVEITYCSAYTKYELIYDNVNYGPVTAEYV